MTTTFIKATVKYSAKPYETQYGTRVNCLVTLGNGEEVKLWGSPNDPIVNLRKGQAITLFKDSKGYKLVEDAPQPDRCSPLPQEEKQAIASYGTELVSLLSFLHSEVSRKMPDVGEETAQKYATTAFITIQKKFNL